MKITCQSCQSKYNVADEKVQGKIVKIRCRKCGATIVVNGVGGAVANGTTADSTAQQGASAAGDNAQWHVNVADNDQRTMTLHELVDAYNTGVVTQDTFIWTDGMDDWKPLAEVDVVVAALHESANQLAAATPGAFEPQAPAAHAAAYDAPAAAHAYDAPATAHAYEAPAAAAYEAPAAFAAAASPEPKRAAVAKREARARDLFATNAGEELQTSAPAVPQGMPPAGGDAGGLTGQRNENSVLFSLAVLTKNAEERAPNDVTEANKEDSGLIDLKALAAKAESMRPPAMVDDGVFHAPLGLAPPPLGAPVGAFAGGGAEAQPKSKLPLMIGLGAGMLVLVVVSIVVGMKLGASPAPAPPATVVITAPPTAEPSVTAAAPSVEPSASAAPSASVAATAKKPAFTGGAGWKPPAGGGVQPKPGGGAVGGSGGAAAPPPAPKKGGGDCGCNGDLMCLMKCSTH